MTFLLKVAAIAATLLETACQYAIISAFSKGVCNFNTLMDFEYSPNFDVDCNYYEDFDAVDRSNEEKQKTEEVYF